MSFLYSLTTWYDSHVVFTAVCCSGQHNELVIGNVHGDLLIFKGYNGDGKPWAKASELGMVTDDFAFLHFRYVYFEFCLSLAWARLVMIVGVCRL